VLATLLLPPLRDALHPDTAAFPNPGQLVLQSAQSIVEQLKASRRDSELARQILLATRYLFPSSNPQRKRPHLDNRDYYQDALRLVEIVTDAESSNPMLAGRPLPAPEGGPETVAEETLPEDLQPSERAGRRRGRRDRRPAQPGAPVRTGEPASPPPSREAPAPIIVSGRRSPAFTPIPSLIERPTSLRPASWNRSVWQPLGSARRMIFTTAATRGNQFGHGHDHDHGHDSPW